MKTLILTFALMLGLCCSVLPQVQADDKEPAKTKVKKKRAKTKVKKKRAKTNPVADALAEAGYFTETEARPRAKFYIFICSASWCGPCRALMPQVVKEYETNMKKDKSVSLVLLGFDRTEEDAKKYIEHYDTDIPGVLNSAVTLPNSPNISGIPWFFILNSKGELVTAGAGNRILEWKNAIKIKPQKTKKSSRRNR